MHSLPIYCTYVFIFHHRITEWFDLKVIYSNLLQWAVITCKLHKKLKDHNSPMRCNIVFKASVAVMSFIAMDVQKKMLPCSAPALNAEAEWWCMMQKHSEQLLPTLQVLVRKGEWCLIRCLGESPEELHALSFCWWNSHSVMLNATEWEGQDIYSRGKFPYCTRDSCGSCTFRNNVEMLGLYPEVSPIHY